jgi:hypothetical protein
MGCDTKTLTTAALIVLIVLLILYIISVCKVKGFGGPKELTEGLVSLKDGAPSYNVQKARILNSRSLPSKAFTAKVPVAVAAPGNDPGSISVSSSYQEGLEVTPSELAKIAWLGY